MCCVGEYKKLSSATYRKIVVDFFRFCHISGSFLRTDIAFGHKNVHIQSGKMKLRHDNIHGVPHYTGKPIIHRIRIFGCAPSNCIEWHEFPFLNKRHRRWQHADDSCDCSLHLSVSLSLHPHLPRRRLSIATYTVLAHLCRHKWCSILISRFPPSLFLSLSLSVRILCQSAYHIRPHDRLVSETREINHSVGFLNLSTLKDIH